MSVAIQNANLLEDAAGARVIGEDEFFATRKMSLTIAEPLTPEDMTVQAMDDASPTKWHLAPARPPQARASHASYGR